MARRCIWDMGFRLVPCNTTVKDKNCKVKAVVETMRGIGGEIGDLFWMDELLFGRSSSASVWSFALHLRLSPSGPALWVRSHVAILHHPLEASQDINCDLH